MPPQRYLGSPANTAGRPAAVDVIDAYDQTEHRLGAVSAKPRRCLLEEEPDTRVTQREVLLSAGLYRFAAQRGPEYTVKCDVLWNACRDWHRERGLRFTLVVNQFSRKLRGVYPQVVGTERPQDEDDPKRPRWFGGIRLRVQKAFASASAKPAAPIVETAAAPSECVPLTPKLRRI
jgi:hypothetical protein